jgi:hemerythrin
MLIWNETFATGSETIDGQHKMLILHINQLEQRLNNTRPEPRNQSGSC